MARFFCLNLPQLVHNTRMREIQYKLDDTKLRIERLKGLPVKLLINRGRNKFFEYDGCVDTTYPNVFTVRVSNYDTPLMTFSYSDVMTKNIRFLKPD
jgi:Protein of unknown function (DUF1021).